MRGSRSSVDGCHDNPEQAEHDSRRNAWLANHGIETMRVPASEVLADATETSKP
jgi:very-short-patch-repair endonuclease